MNVHHVGSIVHEVCMYACMHVKNAFMIYITYSAIKRMTDIISIVYSIFNLLSSTSMVIT